MWGEQAGEECGTSVSISLRGDYLAFGCPKASKIEDGKWMEKVGKVEVMKINYDLANKVWEAGKIDQPIWGESTGDESGTAIALGDNRRKVSNHTYNMDELYIAIGAPYNNSNYQKVDAGHIRVYHLDKIFKWMRANLDIDGLNYGDKLGSSVAITYDGHRVVAGAPGKSAYVKIYDLQYTAEPSLAPTSYPTPSPTRSKPTKPSNPTNQKPVAGSNGDSNKRGGTSPILSVIVILILVPGTVYLVFKGVVYYRGRNSYNSQFGSDVNVVSASNDLELAPSMNNQGSEPLAHDII